MHFVPRLAKRFPALNSSYSASRAMTATATANSTPAKCLLVLNGDTVLSDSIGSETFLREYPKGAYTTMRTMTITNKVGVFMYERHVKRLANSCSVMMQQQQQQEQGKRSEKMQVLSEEEEVDTVKDLRETREELQMKRFEREVKSVLCDKSKLQREITPCIQMAIARYLERYGDVDRPLDSKPKRIALESNGGDNGNHSINNGDNGGNDNDNNGEHEERQRNVNAQELKISHLITWDFHECRYSFYTHVCDLPMRPTVPVLCDIRGGSRADIKGKDSTWVMERKKLWQATTCDANEIVMCESDGSLREGVSSNFFVVYDDGTVVTASENIVQGTVMQLLFDVCNDLGVKVVRRPAGPTLQELPKWREAFITSTSRLILPIGTFVIGEDCMKDLSSLRRDDKFITLLTTDESLHNGEYKYTLPSTDLTLKLFRALHRRMEDMTTVFD